MFAPTRLDGVNNMVTPIRTSLANIMLCCAFMAALSGLSVTTGATEVDFWRPYTGADESTYLLASFDDDATPAGTASVQRIEKIGTPASAPGVPAVFMARGFITLRFIRRTAVVTGGYFVRIPTMKMIPIATIATTSAPRALPIPFTMTTSLCPIVAECGQKRAAVEPSSGTCIRYLHGTLGR